MEWYCNDSVMYRMPAHGDALIRGHSRYQSDLCKFSCGCCLTFTNMAAATYDLFCIGNPLLDIQVTNGEELLKKYDLKANDAILAEEKQMPM
jgi:hypothetical protein